MPTNIKPRILATAINKDDNTASLALAMEVAGYFELDAAKAREIAAQVGKAVSKWRDVAAGMVSRSRKSTAWLQPLNTKIWRWRARGGKRRVQDENFGLG